MWWNSINTGYNRISTKGDVEFRGLLSENILT